jgi:hypothetical protein
VKYNRAWIIRNETSIPLLKFVDTAEDSAYWLFDSGESFHGEEDGKFFYFKDSRIPTCLILPLSCVELEFSEEDFTINEVDGSWYYDESGEESD